MKFKLIYEYLIIEDGEIKHSIGVLDFQNKDNITFEAYIQMLRRDGGMIIRDPGRPKQFIPIFRIQSVEEVPE